MAIANIYKQNRTKIHGFRKENFVNFQNVKKINENQIENQILLEANFLILIIYKPSLGPCDVPHKIWARSVQPF